MKGQSPGYHYSFDLWVSKNGIIIYTGLKKAIEVDVGENHNTSHKYVIESVTHGRHDAKT